MVNADTTINEQTVPLSETTALRLTEALEKLAQAIEMQGLPPLPGQEHMSAAEIAATLGGPEGLRTYNERTGKSKRGRKARAK